MVFISRPRFGVFCGIFGIGTALVLSGCGGGSTANPDPTGPFEFSGRLTTADFYDDDTNRYYDVYVCDAGGSSTGLVQMRSDDVDCVLYVYRKQSDGDFELIGENDDANSGTVNAAVEFNVSRGQTYRIVATTSPQNERGDYEIRFSGDLNRPALLLPNGNRTLQIAPLPAAKKK